jgi:hypothetical protein
LEPRGALPECIAQRSQGLRPFILHRLNGRQIEVAFWNIRPHLDQVRSVLRVRRYALRTERAYCDWIRRYVKFQGWGACIFGAGRWSYFFATSN